MTTAPPTSILLPTTRWSQVIDELSSQLRSEDELLVICDSESDTVASRSTRFPQNVHLIVAGEPEQCSGKANAIAAGLKAAKHDLIVWTDDDFSHPDGWLSQLQKDYETSGPVGEIPFFVGADPLSVLLEPAYALWGSLPLYLGNRPWAGAVIFSISDLQSSRDMFIDRLTNTVSDDGLLADEVSVTTHRRVRPVKVGGSVRATLERHVRFTKIIQYSEARSPILAGLIILSSVCCLLFPWLFLVLTTLASMLSYLSLQTRRWTFILAYPSLLLLAPLLLYSLCRRSFVWHNRRYYWDDRFTVRIACT